MNPERGSPNGSNNREYQIYNKSSPARITGRQGLRSPVRSPKYIFRQKLEVSYFVRDAAATSYGMKQNTHNTATLNYTGIGVLNVFLLAATILLMIYFVIVSNVITASSYRIGLLNEELAGLTEMNGILTAQKLSIENSSTILSFAQAHHMIEAGHIVHIFESGNVALQR